MNKFLLPIHCISFIGLALVVFHLYETALFLRWDGTLHLVSALNLFQWTDGFFSFSLDFLKANGELDFPHLLTLDPGYIVGHLMGGVDSHRAVVYATQSGVYFVSIIVFARGLGFSLATSIAGAWAMCLATLPFFVPTLTFIRLWGNPTFMSGFSACLMAVGLIAGIGPGTLWNRLLRTGLVVILISYAAAAFPVVFAMAAPALAWYGIAQVLAMPHEVRRRGFVLAVLVALISLPFTSFSVEFHLYSKATFFWSEMDILPISYRFISFLIYIHGEGSLIGAMVLASGIAGAVETFFNGDRRLRIIAAAYLGFIVMLFTIVSFAKLGSGVWRGPPLAYLDLAQMPMHFLFLIRFVQWAASQLAKWAPFSPTPGSTVLSLALAAPWIAVPVATAGRDGIPEDLYWPFPMTKTPIVAQLESEIGLRAGRPFQGRVVNLAGTKGPYKSAFNNQHSFDNNQIRRTGNDHRNNGFWARDIPTLNSSTQFTTPFFHLVASRLLNPRNSVSVRAHVQATRYRPGILAGLGVRYVLHDRDIAGARRLGTFGEGRLKLFLYELPDANRGHFSPTHTEVVADVLAAIEALNAPGFDYRRSAVLHTPISAPLVEARTAGLIVDRGGLSIEASSAGTSLLALPVEFSHCLKLEKTPGFDQQARLMRINVNQTGLVFRGAVSARLTLRFGALVNRGCRLEDLLDAKSLGMESTVGWWPKDSGNEPDRKQTAAVMISRKILHYETTVTVSTPAPAEGPPDNSAAAILGGDFIAGSDVEKFRFLLRVPAYAENDAVLVAGLFREDGTAFAYNKVSIKGGTVGVALVEAWINASPNDTFSVQARIAVVGTESVTLNSRATPGKNRDLRPSLTIEHYSTPGVTDSDR